MLDPNTILQDRYLIMRRIGHGGMGAVYLAKDQRLGSLVALKETFFTDDRMRKAFEREARLLASLRHPALPRVSDHFAEGDGQFLVMEYIAGDDLEQMLARRGDAFTSAEVLTWADQLLDALDYLHTQKPPIIHRDIKPQNLKLTDRGQIILLDFGLAKGAVSDVAPSAGGSSILGYTPGYAPLEQIQAAGTDARSDLYSLAATLYRLMTNSSPADALGRATAVVNGEHDPLVPAHEINQDVAAAVALVLHRAMNLKCDARPATASAMRQALRTASHASIETIVVAPARGDASHAATVINSLDAQTVAAPTDEASPRHPATKVMGAARPSNVPLASPGVTARNSTMPNRHRALWAAIVIVSLLAAGVVAWVVMNNTAKTTGGSANSNSAVEEAHTNANSRTTNADPTAVNANQATANAAPDGDNLNANTQPLGRKISARPRRGGIGGFFKKVFRGGDGKKKVSSEGDDKKNKEIKNKEP